jgi:predicted nuclease with TOPRIM domain
MAHIDELISERKALLARAEEVEREIEEVQEVAYRLASRKNEVLERFLSGDGAVKSFGRLWWVSQNGDLLGLVSDREEEMLGALAKDGILFVEKFAV